MTEMSALQAEFLTIWDIPKHIFLTKIMCGFIKGIKNGCPCIVEIRGTQGCALVGDPAGECRDVAKAQP